MMNKNGIIVSAVLAGEWECSIPTERCTLKN